MVSKRFHRRLKRATVIPATINAAAGLVLVSLIFYLLSTYSWVNHTDQVLADATQMGRLMSDSETGLRGYLLARHDDFLQPYKQAQAELPDAIQALTELVADNPSQAGRVGQLMAKSKKWSELAAEALANPDAASKTTGLQRKVVMDDFRAQLENFLSTEKLLRGERVEHARFVATLTVIITLVVAGGAGLVIALMSRKHLIEATSVYRQSLETTERQAAELKQAYEAVDRELEAVAAIQQSLLPNEAPNLPQLEVATSYRTSKHSGGDYYDFFPLPGGKWGFLIADVSGHGTPAAVLMAVTHSLAHNPAGEPTPPSTLLSFVNRRLCLGYTRDSGTFVTAFYGIYDPSDHSLTFSSAGHPPPRWIQANGDGKPLSVEAEVSLPLGIDSNEQYGDRTIQLNVGDALVLYTDGITEARGREDRQLFGTDRLDSAIELFNGRDERLSADELCGVIVNRVNDFTQGEITDDRTLLVLRICTSQNARGEPLPQHHVTISAA